MLVTVCVCAGSPPQLDVYSARLGGGERGESLHSSTENREMESQENCHED